jgi:signal transduction histidine kinase/DNA-binding NarL/FixJ family response regulator
VSETLEAARSSRELAERALRVLYLEDNPGDALLVRESIRRSGVPVEFIHTSTAPEYCSALDSGNFDLILSDNGLPGFSGQAALEMARLHHPQTPFVFVSGAAEADDALRSLKAGATDYVPKDQIWRLALLVQQIASRQIAHAQRLHQAQAMERLVKAVEELSQARSLESIVVIVRKAARELTGADGATFVLRDGEYCFYADEDAIAPLWKGQRFALRACISGWVMSNRQAVAIEDIYHDPRIPADAYRPTFVKSLVMVPVCTEAPIAAIGNYWATLHQATDKEIELLQALANTTSVAIENVQLYSELERRVEQRTMQLAHANRELEAFSYSVSHDLRAPLQHISGFAALMQEDGSSSLSAESQECLDRILAGTKQMRQLIDDLLRLAKFSQVELKSEVVSLSEIAASVTAELKSRQPERRVEFRIEEGLEVRGDPGLLRVTLENLIQNAWKYSSKQQQALIEFGSQLSPEGKAYFVRDNGVGFEPKYADRLFAPFRRLHMPEEFPGHGVGLATVRRIIHRHGGRIWAEAEPEKGATFYFTLETVR